MSPNRPGEGDLRRTLIEADFADCMAVLPGQLLYSTQIPLCLWFLAKNKAAHAKCGLEFPRRFEYNPETSLDYTRHSLKIQTKPMHQ